MGPNRSVANALLRVMTLAALLTGCGPGSDPPKITTPVGTFQMALTTQSNGTTYRLRNGKFAITGPVSTTLDTEADPTAAVLAATLPVGSYGLDLLDGWFLERLDSATFVVVQATLVSANPTTFSIGSAATTSVAYQFVTDGTIVSIGTGTVDVRITVQELPGVCDATCQAVCVPQLTAAIATIPPSVCSPPETLTSPVGDVQICSASTCTDGTTGCEASIGWTLDVAGGLYVATASISEPVDVSATVLGVPVNCTLVVTANVQVTVQPAFFTLGGFLHTSVQSIQTTVTSASVSGCGDLGAVLDTLAPLFETQATTAASNELAAFITQTSVPCAL
jgi:hypothetical protein